MQTQYKVMFMVIVMLKLYPSQKQFLEQPKQEEWPRAGVRGKLSSSAGDTLHFASLLVTSFTKPMPGNVFCPESSSPSAVSTEAQMCHENHPILLFLSFIHTNVQLNLMENSRRGLRQSVTKGDSGHCTNKQEINCHFLSHNLPQKLLLPYPNCIAFLKGKPN